MSEQRDEQLETRRDEATSRYEGRLDGEVVTTVEFVRTGDVLLITHTGTDPRFRGRGLAAAVTRAALEDVRERGEQVRAGCSYAAEFLSAHPEFDDLRA